MSRVTAPARAVPCGGVVRGRLGVPPSKSVTQRYFNLALLAAGPVRIEGPLDSEDTRHFLVALAAVGCDVLRRPDAVEIAPGPPPERPVEIFCGNGGTMLRFLTASLAARPGRWILDGAARLRERPVGPLVDALRKLGARIDYLGEPGRPPVRIDGGFLAGGDVRLAAGESSQYLSALLMAALAAGAPVTVEVESLVSAPYAELTRRAIARFGAQVEAIAPARYRVTPAALAGRTVRVEGDYSAAAYPAAAAALTGGDVELTGLERESAQGDARFFDLLAAMGAAISWQDGSLRVRGRTLAGLAADLSSLPDQVPTLAALAPFAAGRTEIAGVPHLRLKESDRLAAISRELGRSGADVEELPAGLVIHGVWARETPPEEPVVLDPHDDHRIAMSCALLGLRRPGVSVAHPEVVAKSYPAFWDDLEGLLA